MRDNPDLGGGLALVESDRHKGYIDSKTIRKNVARVVKKTGFVPLTPGSPTRCPTVATVTISPAQP